MPTLPQKDENALPAGTEVLLSELRRLTTGRIHSPCHQAARECLTVLEQHAEERDYNRTLLLPASEETDPETLLRATHWRVEAGPVGLLRASSEETR